MFDNIVIHQADVDRDPHTEWVRRLRFSRRIYVTVNERDAVLNASDIINPDRLGNTVEGPVLQRPYYVDFTGSDKVGKTHQLFGQALANPHVAGFFSRALHGQEAHAGSGLSRHEDSGFYRVS